MKMQAIIHFAILALSLNACNKTETKNEKPALPQAIHTIEIQRGEIEEGLVYLADIVSKKSVKITAQVPGTAANLKIAENTPIPKGTIVASVLTPDIAARVSRVRTERRRAEKERDFVCQMVVTDRALAKSGDLSRFALEKSTKNCESAELAVSVAKFAEKEVRVNKGKSTERAPFDGRVIKYFIEDGQHVGPGMPILSFASETQTLQLLIPAVELDSVKIGTPTFSTFGKGKVVDIGAQARGPGRLVEVQVELDNAQYLMPGRRVKVTLVTKSNTDATIIPLSALGEEGKENYVIVIRDGKQHRQIVTSGIQSMGKVSILPHLEKGTRIVDGGLSTLKPTAAVWEVAQ